MNVDDGSYIAELQRQAILGTQNQVHFTAKPIMRYVSFISKDGSQTIEAERITRVTIWKWKRFIVFGPMETWLCVEYHGINLVQKFIMADQEQAERAALEFRKLLTPEIPK